MKVDSYFVHRKVPGANSTKCVFSSSKIDQHWKYKTIHQRNDFGIKLQQSGCGEARIVWKCFLKTSS